MQHEHDKGFKELLGHSSVFAQLLSSFIGEEWTRHINPDALERVPSSFIIPTFEKREADLIYKLNKPGNREEVYFYCLIELQSTVDYSMPIRLLVYMASLWMELLKKIPEQERSRKDFRLPLIIPLVLYNGREAWTAVREFAQVYGEVRGFGKEYAVNFRYYLVDVNRYRAEELLGKENLVGAVLFMDQRGEAGRGGEFSRELVEKLVKLGLVLEKLERKERRLFVRWLEGIVQERIAEGSKLKQVLEELSKEEEAGMFVSNFALEFGEAMKAYEEALVERERLKVRVEEMEAEKARAEQEKALVERERVRAEREKARAEQALRQTVRLMKAAGIPLETIAATTGLSPIDLEAL